MATYALIKQGSGYYVIGKVARENKRHAWIEYPSGEIFRETLGTAAWRFETYEDAQRQLTELEKNRS
jgi:hypothetical protein